MTLNYWYGLLQSLITGDLRKWFKVMVEVILVEIKIILVEIKIKVEKIILVEIEIKVEKIIS